MRFVHFSDTHLGRKNFKIDERERDFESAFRQVIDFALENEADFIVHSGDIVDTGKPPYGAINFLVTQLKRLKKKGVPFFTVPGSHDVAPDGTIISVLDRAGLLVNLGSERYYKHEGDKVVLKGEVFKNVFLAGIIGKRARIEQFYSRIIPEFQESGFRIFVFHHIIKDISEKFGDIEKDLLPKGFDYYAGGHTHSKFVADYGKGVVAYPGSTEIWDVREKGEKGFFFYDNGLQWVPLETREFVELDIKVDGSPEEITSRVMKEIKHSKDSVLLIRIKGKLAKGTKSDINRTRIMEAAKERGYLFANIYMSDLANPEEEDIDSEEKSLEEIEREYLEKSGYSGEKLRIAMEMIAKFGDKRNQQEIEHSVEELMRMGEAI